MRWLVNVGQLGVKELRSLWHDKVLALIVMLAFSFMVYSGAVAANRELRNAPIAVVDEDRSALSARMIGAFYPPYFKPPELIPLSRIDPTLDEGRYTFVLDIPPDFERDVLSGREPVIQVNIDATRMSQAFIGATQIQNVLTSEIAEFTRGYRTESLLPVGVAERVMFNPNLTGMWFGGVMEIINNITMLSIVLTGAALIREREHGTIEHLLAMPLTPLEIMMAKVWANGLVVLVAAALSLRLIVQGMLGVPIAGSVTLFLLGATVHLFSTTSIGILLGTVARSMPQLSLLIMLVILPLQLLSGGVTPRESMPAVVQNIMLIAPTTHFVSLAQAILYRGAGFSVVWQHLAAITAIGAGFFLWALARFRRSLAASR